MGRISRYILRKPALFFMGALSTFLVLFLINTISLGYLEFSKLREHWRERFMVRAFFREDVSEETMHKVAKEIAASFYITQVVLVPPEEAKKRFLERTGLSPESVEGVSFPASLEVVPKYIENLLDIVRELKENPSFGEVLYGGQEVENFLRLFQLFVRFSRGFFLGVLGFGVCVIVVITAFSVQLRRREVAVLSLVGATDGFAFSPFFLEGILFGLCGGIGAYLCAAFFLFPLLRLAEEVFPGFFGVQIEEHLLWLFVLDLLGGCGMGMVGTLFGYLGVRQSIR
ncbi:MAG: permease-like cell division protein FtsX [Atribacterota bacterium]